MTNESKTFDQSLSDCQSFLITSWYASYSDATLIDLKIDSRSELHCYSFRVRVGFPERWHADRRHRPRESSMYPWFSLYLNAGRADRGSFSASRRLTHPLGRSSGDTNLKACRHLECIESSATSSLESSLDSRTEGSSTRACNWVSERAREREIERERERERENTHSTARRGVSRVLGWHPARYDAYVNAKGNVYHEDRPGTDTQCGSRGDIRAAESH